MFSPISSSIQHLESRISEAIIGAVDTAAAEASRLATAVTPARSVEERIIRAFARMRNAEGFYTACQFAGRELAHAPALRGRVQNIANQKLTEILGSLNREGFLEKMLNPQLLSHREAAQLLEEGKKLKKQYEQLAQGATTLGLAQPQNQQLDNALVMLEAYLAIGEGVPLGEIPGEQLQRLLAAFKGAGSPEGFVKQALIGKIKDAVTTVVATGFDRATPGQRKAVVDLDRSLHELLREHPALFPTALFNAYIRNARCYIAISDAIRKRDLSSVTAEDLQELSQLPPSALNAVQLKLEGMLVDLTKALTPAPLIAQLRHLIPLRALLPPALATTVQDRMIETLAASLRAAEEESHEGGRPREKELFALLPLFVPFKELHDNESLRKALERVDVAFVRNMGKGDMFPFLRDVVLPLKGMWDVPKRGTEGRICDEQTICTHILQRLNNATTREAKELATSEANQILRLFSIEDEHQLIAQAVLKALTPLATPIAAPRSLWDLLATIWQALWAICKNR